ncbi:MAG: flagellar biosynthesis protein FlhA [Pseudomonadota bacterium]
MIGKLLGESRDLALVIGTIIILLILFSPIPPFVLDLAIIINFGLGLTILLLTFYVAKPVEFSTFPSLLLVATLFRLALNVAATRLILTGADAGDVIGSIGSYAVQGNFVIGLVVFFILVVVQYVVITSGAQRVSEVAARFTLDSMPGQQMSIDADLNMGLIDQKEAIARRRELEKEANFYGSMDGASKFVKGDAIAGIIILLIDIIAGWIVGVVQMDMSWIDALQHFTLLTIGDGIATQLPALIISIATGIIVTRSAADRELGTEVLTQLSSVPRIPVIVTAALLLLMLLPGMPKWPIVIIIMLLGLVWWRIRRQRQSGEAEDRLDDTSEETDGVDVAAVPLPIEIGLGPALHDQWHGEAAIISSRVGTLRREFTEQFGFGFAEVKLRQDSRLKPQGYAIRLSGVPHGEGEILSDKLLAVRSENVMKDLDGISATDPAFGLPAYWIDEDLRQEADSLGYTLVDPMTVLITHLSETLKSEVDSLLTRNDVVQMLEGVRSRQAGMIEDLIPNIMAVADVQRVMQRLLEENVSIANTDLIAETLVDTGRQTKDIATLTEHVRQRMKNAICHRLRGDHAELAVLSLDPRYEHRIMTNVGNAGSEPPASAVVEPSLAEKLLRKLLPLTEAMGREGRNPVLLCGPELRRHLRALTRRSIPRLAVLSVDEIPMKIALQSFAVVEYDDDSG